MSDIFNNNVVLPLGLEPEDTVRVPVSRDVTGFTELVVEFGPVGVKGFEPVVATVSTVTRVDARTVEILPPVFGFDDGFGDRDYRVLRDDVVIGSGRLFDYKTAAKAKHRRENR